MLLKVSCALGSPLPARVGEMIARAREESARRAQAASEQHARELASRFEAEKQLAR